jgi:hypothetical protein
MSRISSSLASGSTSSVGQWATLSASGGDDTAAFQAAINVGNVLLLGDKGDFHVGQVTFAGASRVIRALTPVKIIQTAALGVFDLRGGWDALGSVSSYATTTSDLVTPGESNPTSTRTDVSVLTLGAAATVAVGDVVKVVADDQIPTARNTTDRIGEYALVGKDSTGNTVTLTRRLVENYITNVRLARLKKVTFRIEGPITFDTDPAIRDTVVWGAAVLLRAAQNCYVGGGVEFHNSLGRAIGNFTFGGSFEGIKFRNLANRPSLSQYGYGVHDGGWATRVLGCHGENLRHLYTTGDNTVSAGDSLYEYFGGGWYGLVADSIGVNCQAQPFDTHGDGYGISFINCKAVGTFQGASSGGFGISLRGRNHFVSGCTVMDSWGGINIVSAGTIVENCVVRRAAYKALQISGDTDDAIAVTTLSGIRVTGGTYETTGGSETATIGRTGYTVTAELVGVRFRQTVGANGGRLVGVTASTLHASDLTFDFSDATTTGSLIGIYGYGSSPIAVRARGLRVVGGAAPAAGFSFLNSDGVVGSVAGTVVRLEDIRYTHASLGPVAIGQTWSDARVSWRGTFSGANWWQKDAGSQYISVTAAANLTITAISQVLDQDVSVYLAGTAGEVTIAALPAGLLGMRLTIWNASNGDVTIPGLNVITAGTGKTYIWVNNSWKAL